MAFPASPTNGQTTTLNNITYVYNSTLGVWDVQGSSATASPVSSVASRTGAVTLTAADIGAGTFSGTFTIGTLTVTNGVTATAFTGSGSGLTGTAASLSIGGSAASATTATTASSATTATTATNLSGGSVSGTTGAFSGTLSVTGVATLSSNLAVSGGTQLSSLGVGTAASATAGEIRATNYITAFYSDARLKTEIGRIENALDRVDQLTGILYTQNKLAESFGYNNYQVQVGLRAQDVQIAQPEAVKPAPFDIAEDGSSKSGENYLTVQYEKLVPLLVEAIKELRVELNMLKGLK